MKFFEIQKCNCGCIFKKKSTENIITFIFEIFKINFFSKLRLSLNVMIFVKTLSISNHSCGYEKEKS